MRENPIKTGPGDSSLIRTGIIKKKGVKITRPREAIDKSSNLLA
jgi:hypothetical protein